MTLPASFESFWRARNHREQRMLIAGTALLLAMLIWLLLIDPALDARTRWQKDLPVMRDQLAQMRALSAQVSSLPARSATSLASGNEWSRATIERSLNEQGLKPQTFNMTEQGLSTSFADVPFGALTEWLQQSQSSARLVVADAAISARERLGRVDARLTLQRAQ